MARFRRVPVKRESWELLETVDYFYCNGDNTLERTQLLGSTEMWPFEPGQVSSKYFKFTSG